MQLIMWIFSSPFLYHYLYSAKDIRFWTKHMIKRITNEITNQTLLNVAENIWACGETQCKQTTRPQPDLSFSKSSLPKSLPTLCTVPLGVLTSPNQCLLQQFLFVGFQRPTVCFLARFARSTQKDHEQTPKLSRSALSRKWAALCGVSTSCVPLAIS